MGASVIPKFPAFTFIAGPAGAGKTTLATLLSEADRRVAWMSFDEVIRETTLGIFWPENIHDGSVDLRRHADLTRNLPFTSTQAGTFMSQLRGLLKQMNPHLIGDLCKKRAGFVYGPMYDHVIFDDTEDPDNLIPFPLAFGAHNCQIIFVERAGHTLGPTLYTFRNTLLAKRIIKNVEGKPEEMLKLLIPGTVSATEGL